MRIVVTGREGQVARSLSAAGPRFEAEVVCLGRPDFDLEQPEAAVASLVAAKPDIIISAAAYTAVDKAESEPDKARAVNAEGAAAAARAAHQAGVPILHISTDYVFDGRLQRPYVEDDATAPLGVYGWTKLEGERAVAATVSRHFILRTAWVYSPFGHNFVKTMLRLAQNRDEISVVADQFGCPTSAGDIADVLLELSRRLVAGEGEKTLASGIYHMASRGEASWADMAQAVFAQSRALGGVHARVKRIDTASYPTPAKRPANSRLNAGKLAALGIELPAWKASLDECVKTLHAQAL